MKNFPVKPLCAVLACALVMSACGATSEKKSNPVSINSNSQENTGASASQNTDDTLESLDAQSKTELLTGYMGASDYAATNEGFYQVIANPNGGCNILYTDFSSGKTIYLCNQPNCVHDNDACTSWVAAQTAELFSAPDESGMYCIMGSTNGDELWSMNPAGGDRKLLYQCAADERLLDAIAGNEKSLYFSVMSMQMKAGTMSKNLLQLDTATGKTTKLLEYPAQTWLFGAYQNTLILLYYDEPTFTYRTYDLQTGTLTDLYSYSVDSEGKGAFARPYENKLFIFEPVGENKANLEVMDIETKKREPVVSDIEYYGSESMSVSGFYDGCMSVFVTNPSSHEKKHYLIDINSGDVFSIDLQYQQGEISVPVDIYASANDKFIVNCGISAQNILLQNNDGTSYVSQIDAMEYAFIDKADYIQNKFNISKINIQ